MTAQDARATLAALDIVEAARAVRAGEIAHDELARIAMVGLSAHEAETPAEAFVYASILVQGVALLAASACDVTRLLGDMLREARPDVEVPADPMGDLADSMRVTAEFVRQIEGV